MSSTSNEMGGQKWTQHRGPESIRGPEDMDGARKNYEICFLILMKINEQQ